MKKREHDVEKGGRSADRAQFGPSTAPGYESYDDLDEYTALNKYISTYRDNRVGPASQTAKDAAQSPPWWKFWKHGPSTAIPKPSTKVVPQDWLNTTIQQGLSQADVESRRKEFGWNELTTEKENSIKKFLSYFKGPILYGSWHHLKSLTELIAEVMELAVLLSAGLQDWVDFGVIIGILLLNATVGWYQEKQAADVVASLKGDIAMKANVVRDGHEQSILAKEIVPGDIVCPPLSSFLSDGACRNGWMC